MSDYLNTKSILVYFAIAVAVALGVAIALSLGTSHSYSIAVTLFTNTTPGSTVYPYQTSHFVVTVNNTGSAAITSMPFITYLNGNPLNTYKVTIPPHESGTIQFNYTYPYNGTYQFSAIADPAHVFQITDRASAQSSLELSVQGAQPVHVLSSISNSNVSRIAGFALTESATYIVPAFGLGYNLSMVNNMLGPAKSVMIRVLQDLSQTIASGSGATIAYQDNSVATSLWLNGTLGPGLVARIVNSFSIPQNAIKANGTPAYYARVSNTTSMCFFYSQGWTKIVSYYNASTNSTCARIVATSHNDSQSQRLTSIYNTTPGLANLSRTFIYSNSIYLGQSLSSGGGNASISTVFSNPYGYFIASISHFSRPRTAKELNLTCDGLVYNGSKANICAAYVYPTGNTGLQVGLLNESEVTPNYTASLYSFVTQANLTLAHDNGLALISALNLSDTYKWSSLFRNTCQMSNTSLSCSALAFNHTTLGATIGLTNSLPKQVRVNSVSCSSDGSFHNQTVNQSIAPHSTASLNVTCHNIIVPVAEVETTYVLMVNYTYNSRPVHAYGLLNISNLVV